MGKQKLVSGEICEIISCEEKSGYRRKCEKDCYIENEYEQRHRSEWVARFDMQTDSTYEYLLCKEAKWENMADESMWSSEPDCLSEEIWYEYDMIIKYLYQNHTYKKRMKWEWYTKTLEAGQVLYLLFNQDAPEKIVQISMNNCNDKALLYFMGGLMMCLLLVVLIYVL